MNKIFQRLLDGIPDYQEFMTLSEMDESSRSLARQYPHSTELIELGRTRENRPVLCLKIGEGEKNALMFGCPHPNEPIGSMLLEYVSEQLAADGELRRELGYTWYIIKAWDADGLVKNEGWLKGPFSIYNYGRNFFRPPGREQVDWTFPVDHRLLHFHDVLPETELMMELIDQIQPEFIYSLHNSGFGGVYWYESQATPEIYEKLYSTAHRQRLPLSLGAAEIPSAVQYAPAIFQCSSIKDEYDYLEKYGSAEEREKLPEMQAGDNSASYARERYGSFTLLTELPYFYDPRIADTSPSDMSRLEALQHKERDEKCINQELRQILALSKRWMREENPFAAAVEDFSGGNSDAFICQAECDPAYLQPASEAEKLDYMVLGKFYKMILYGMLVRANEMELAETSSTLQPEKYDELKQGYEAALEGFERITQFLEDHLQYQVVPIRKLITVQLESGLLVLDYLRRR